MKKKTFVMKDNNLPKRKCVWSIDPIDMPLRAWKALVNKVERMKG